MSYTQETTLWCDSLDCPEWVQLPQPSIRDARIIGAVMHGWALRRSDRQLIDLCPLCDAGHTQRCGTRSGGDCNCDGVQP